MKFETFKAGKWVKRYQHKSFEPVPVNQDWTWKDPVINTLIEKNILVEVTGQQRGRVYACNRYLNLFLS